MASEKHGVDSCKFEPLTQEETFGAGGIEQAKFFVWQRLSMLETYPDLFQRFASALMAECISVDKPDDVDLKQGGLTQDDIDELNKLDFLTGYRGNEGYTREYAVAAYRRQLVNVGQEAQWRVALPPLLGSVH